MSTKSPQDKRNKGTLRRPDAGRRLAVHLPPDLVKRLRIRCAEEDCSLSDAVTRAVKEWLGP